MEFLQLLLLAGFILVFLLVGMEMGRQGDNFVFQLFKEHNLLFASTRSISQMLTLGLEIYSKSNSFKTQLGLFSKCKFINFSWFLKNF